MDVNRRCLILITFAAFFSLELREAMADKKTQKYVRKQLVSKTGYKLAILENGEVTGKDSDIKYTYMHLDSHDTGLVTIKGEETGYYVCIDDQGHVHSSKTMTKSCELGESLDKNNNINYHRSIGSEESGMQTVYLAINRRHGNVKSVTHHKRSMQFSFERLKS